MNASQPRVRLAEVRNWSEKARLANYQTAELARVCAVSSRTLERFFIASYGLSPQHWLNRLRQRDMESRLAEDIQLKKVAYLCGYKQPSHMTRQFKQAHGMTPSEWRAINWCLQDAGINARSVTSEGLVQASANSSRARSVLAFDSVKKEPAIDKPDSRGFHNLVTEHS